MSYIDKLNDGQPISKVFTSSRETQYRHLYIVSARKKEALLYCSDERKSILSEWYDHIDDFDNFIYTKVYIGKNYNYIYPTGKLVSPYWSDEMGKMGQSFWPISFNGKYNLIKNDGSLLLHEFADGMWADYNGNNSFVIKRTSTYSREYFRLSSDGKTQYLENNTKYDRMPIVDAYSSRSNLTDRLIIHRRLFSLSIEDINGKELLSNVLRIIKYNARPISDVEGISEGDKGALFSVRKEEIFTVRKNILVNEEKLWLEELLLFYDFATVHCKDGYRIICLSTDSILPDTYEEVQVSRFLFVKVRRNGVWNIIDKYGDYVSKELWFDGIELMNNGNAVVKKGDKYNFLKDNGILLSSEWYDEITPASEDGKFIVCRGGAYNIIDNNMRLSCRKWQNSAEILPCSPKPIHTIPKSWSTIRVYDPIWVDNNGEIVECYVLSLSGNKLTILWPVDDKDWVEAIVVEYRYSNNGESFPTPMGLLYFNKPVR